MEFSEARKCAKDRNFSVVPNKNAAYRALLSTKLQEIFMSHNPSFSNSNCRHQFTRNADTFLPKSSETLQSRAVEGETEEDELVRCISNLPRNLEKGKKIQEKSLNIGVRKSIDYSSTKRTSYSSTEVSTCYNSIGQSSSPARRRMDSALLHSHSQDNNCYTGRRYSYSPSVRRTYHLVPQSHHQKIFPWESPSQNVCRTKHNTGKFKEILPTAPNDRITQKTVSIESDYASSSTKGKMRIREIQPRPPIQEYQPDCSKECNKVVLLLPRDSPMKRGLTQSSDYGGRKSASTKEPHGSSWQDDSKRRFEMRESYSTSMLRVKGPTQPLESPARSRKTEERKSTMVLRTGTESTARARQSSPIRRLSSAMGSFIRSAASRDNSPVRRSISKDKAADLASSEADKSPGGCRARSSPLRRLLDSPRKSLKVKSTSPVCAFLQVAVKNGLPLFTLAVDNDNNILAATVRKLNTAQKNGSCWIYTFFTVHTMKKKNALWMNQGGKGKGHYVPNVIAQMKVSEGDDLREFSLYSVDVDQVDQYATEFQPTDELAAIIVKLPLNTTVILPGGVHTVPSKGSISTLTQRWRSGGACDCGGWDLGCQLRIYRNLQESQNSGNEFKLFSQVGQESRLSLSLKPFKDKIYSVEFDSSVSLIQAFATCVAFLDCKRQSGLFSTSNFFEGRSSFSGDPARVKPRKQSYDEAAATANNVSYPPYSPVERV